LPPQDIDKGSVKLYLARIKEADTVEVIRLGTPIVPIQNHRTFYLERA